jgi:hypothetical protein
MIGLLTVLVRFLELVFKIGKWIYEEWLKNHRRMTEEEEKPAPLPK